MMSEMPGFIGLAGYTAEWAVQHCPDGESRAKRLCPDGESPKRPVSLHMLGRLFVQRREQRPGGCRRGHFSFAHDLLRGQLLAIERFVGAIVGAQGGTLQ